MASTHVSSVTQSSSNALTAQPPTLSSTTPSVKGKRHKDSKKAGTYKTYLDKLGFNSTKQARTDFVEALKSHNEDTRYKFIVQDENPTGYTAMVDSFFEVVGSKYWGSAERGHLLEPDIAKGLLYPKDESILKEIVSNMFNSKARLANASVNKGKDKALLKAHFSNQFDHKSVTWASASAQGECIRELLGSKKRDRPYNPDLTRTTKKRSKGQNGEKVSPAVPETKKLSPAVLETEMISPAVLEATKLFVSATNQLGLAPVIIQLPAFTNIGMVFKNLCAECGLGSELIDKVTNISVTYTWSDEKQRLRKDKEADFDSFSNTIVDAWQKDPDRFTNGCKVEMLLHVDV